MATSPLLAVLYTTLIHSLLQEPTDLGSSGQGDVLVSVSSGQLRGVRRVLTSGQTIHEFKGIPYAQPPTGDLRFAPPQPPLPWSDVKDASRHGNHCPQDRERGVQLVNETAMSEDCLFLNIYSPTPSSSSPSLLPVMVWIHGGGFYLGTGSDYNGSLLASQGQVVVVTLNYRLGALGFLSTGDDVIPGNFGLLDQIMALKWVRLNIRQFGGDPGQVTVFGQSAGGHSASLLSLSPLATGLFHRAILQSGASIAPTSVARMSEATSPREAAVKVGVKFDCIYQDSVSYLSCLRSKPVQEILKADQAAFSEGAAGGRTQLLWKPRVDGVFLLAEPYDLLLNGTFADVDTMHGFCAQEMGVLVNDTEDDGVTETEFKEAIFSTLSSFSLTVADKDHIAKQAVPTFLQGVMSPMDRRSKLIDVLSDFHMAAPITHEVDRIVSSVKILSNISSAEKKHFLYQFSYRGSLLPQYPAWNGVPHGLDIPFVFGLPSKESSFWLGGHRATPTDRKVAEMVVRMWSNFARFGHPMQQSPVKLGTRWPEYRAGQRLIVDIKEHLAVQTVDWTEQDDVFQLMNKRIL